MNTTIVSAEAKARLIEAVKNYTPPPSEKYQALEEVKDCIIELRNKKASYQTIRTMLKESADIEVSHQTIARYCREVLESKSMKTARKEKKSQVASDKKPAMTQKKISTPAATGTLFSSSPRIAHGEDL